jgi:hypothetical protein
MSKIGARLMKAARQARLIVRGEITRGFVAHIPVAVDTKALRKPADHSQRANLMEGHDKA